MPHCTLVAATESISNLQPAQFQGNDAASIVNKSNITWTSKYFYVMEKHSDFDAHEIVTGFLYLGSEDAAHCPAEYLKVIKKF